MFAIAKLPLDCMIRLFPLTPGGEPGTGWASVFHRTSTLRTGVPSFDTLEAAQAALDDDPVSFIMQFDPVTRRCAGVWFTARQQKERIPDRLHRWHGCYGAWEVHTLDSV